ncbi:winged helix-turn-helix domain-containing protein [Prevotella ihumii]|uniref:winged helix-turn-helix domain-containing protein n=1 Tax=Prevotella ihumii TaxID=1917878 RepID=UPI0009816AA6|nr:winged helix-turn-helix domain-containing protein [Prevotella ihumii]
MAEKKTVAAKATKKTPTKKMVSTEISTTDFSPENVGFRAGDVYNALAAAKCALSAAEISEMASISIEDTFLGIGWLLKEGKVKNEESKVVLA